MRLTELSLHCLTLSTPLALSSSSTSTSPPFAEARRSLVWMLAEGAFRQ